MAHSGINLIFEGQNLPRLLGGLWITIRVALIAIIAGGVLGIFLGVLRTFKNRFLRFILRLYLEFFRIVPTVVLLFLFYYILPKSMNLNLPAAEVATLVFTLWMAAEASDIVRGALISVPQHQVDSGLAIGLNRSQLYYYVLIPQSLKLMLPAMMNLISRIIKTTSLLLLISVLDVINVGQQIIEANQKQYPQGAFWVYGVIFVLYFLICYPFSLLAKKLQKD
ncbi:MAG: amino acid ABC transporter permease [Lactobacillus sp.]|jgi:polar amino acid transport system permease protein|nr:amino acid ABC transporter permease [Lactobacillus sp.]